MRKQSSVSFIELFVVFAILAVVAGGIILSFSGVKEDEGHKISQFEMAELKEAILQFKNDTGYLPTQGPFALAADGGRVSVPEQGAVWFKSPANFSQLYENPLKGTGHVLETWDTKTRRGWRGPYLFRSAEGYLDIGDALKQNGTGDPTVGIIIRGVPGVSDPFPKAPEGDYLIWRSGDGGESYERWGRPYFLFDLDDPAKARIVGMGTNGIYDGGGKDDSVLFLSK